MKKTLMILMALALFLPLSACAIHKRTTPDVKKLTLIQKNQQKWHKKIADLPIEHAKGLGNNSSRVPTSMADMKKNSPLVIQGTISNLETMKSSDNMAYTKATIYLNKILAGDQSLQGQSIYTAMNGGITSTNSYFRNMNQTREANHDILVQFQEYPTPKIGAKIIVGMYLTEEPREMKVQNDYLKAMKESNFDFAKTYDLKDVQYGLWVKNPGDKSYHLNNPKALDRLAKEPDQQQALEKFTDELNQKYNK